MLPDKRVEKETLRENTVLSYVLLAGILVWIVAPLFSVAWYFFLPFYLASTISYFTLMLRMPSEEFYGINQKAGTIKELK